MSSTQQALTLDQFLQLPETEPASEYVDGQAVQKVSPKSQHSLLQAILASRMLEAGMARKRGVTFTELRCTFAGRSLVFDVAYRRWDRIRRDQNGAPENDVFEPPDWVMEILSPGQSATDLTARLTWCVDNGVHLGWLLDPQLKELWTFQPGQQPKCLKGSQLARAERLLPGFAFRVDEIFGWLRLADEK